MPKEYIDREAFIEILKETKNDCEHYANKVCCDFAIKMANLMPTADVQEVRHGKWIKEYLSYGAIRYRCSVCNGMFSQNMIDFNHKNFCTDCGAKMDKDCRHKFNECYSDCKECWNTIKESEECKK